MSKSQGVLPRKNNIQQINAESKLKINKNKNFTFG
jgi:hypothetical protein